MQVFLALKSRKYSYSNYFKSTSFEITLIYWNAFLLLKNSIKSNQKFVLFEFLMVEINYMLEYDFML